MMETRTIHIMKREEGFLAYVGAQPQICRYSNKRDSNKHLNSTTHTQWRNKIFAFFLRASGRSVFFTKSGAGGFSLKASENPGVRKG